MSLPIAGVLMKGAEEQVSAANTSPNAWELLQASQELINQFKNVFATGNIWE